MSSRLVAAFFTAGLSACSHGSAPDSTAPAPEQRSPAPAPAPAEQAADDAEQRPPGLPADAGSPPRADALSPEPGVDLSAGVHARGTHRYEIERDAFEAMLANPGAVVGGARVVPALRDGKLIGFKIFAVRRGTLLDALGIGNGDTIRRVNGQELTSPDEALEIYATLGEADEIRVDLMRGGQELSIVYHLMP